MIEPVRSFRIKAHVHALRETNILRQREVERERSLTYVPNGRADYARRLSGFEIGRVHYAVRKRQVRDIGANTGA